LLGPIGMETSRELGKPPFPLSRVQRIVKADKEVAPCSKEGVLAISLAAEMFVKRMARDGQQVARSEKRVTVQQRDIAMAVKRADELFFLQELMGSINGTSMLKEKLKAVEKDVGDDETRV